MKLRGEFFIDFFISKQEYPIFGITVPYLYSIHSEFIRIRAIYLPLVLIKTLLSFSVHVLVQYFKVICFKLPISTQSYRSYLTYTESCKMAKFLKSNKLATSFVKIFLNTWIPRRCQAVVRLNNRWIFLIADFQVWLHQESVVDPEMCINHNQ
jgi:hypothetical protein